MIGALYLLIAAILSFLSSRYIFGGDSAEFSAIAHTWSIPHPPGYPLYALLANCITHTLPFGTIPWRVSLLSVIPTVLTSYILYKILLLLKIRFPIALLSSLLYIVLFPVWEYTLVPEVFALNSFLVFSVSYLLLLYSRSSKNIYILLSALFIGMCVAHHHIFVIFLPGWLALIRDRLSYIVKKRTLLLSLFFAFILGISFYLYAPIASSFRPPIQWEDARTFSGMWRLITRAMYGSFTAYGGSKGNILNQLYDVFSMCVLVFQDFRAVGTLSLVVGIKVSFHKRNIPFFKYLSITSLMYVFFLFYTNFVLSNSFSIGMYERFLISFYGVLVIYVGIGLDAMYTSAIHLVARLSNSVEIMKLTHIFLILILVIYISTITKTNYDSLSYIKNGQDFDMLGKDIINTVPRGGIFFPLNDNAHFTTLYHVVDSDYKNNVIFFQINFMHQAYYRDQFKKKYPTLRYPSSLITQKDLEAFFKLNKKRGVYLETPPAYGFWMPYGLLWKYYETQEEALLDVKEIVSANTNLWAHVYHIPELTSHTRNIMHLQAIQDFYIDAYISYAKLLFITKDNIQSKKVLEIILQKYRPSNMNVKIALFNLLLLEKQCNASSIVGKELLALPPTQVKTEFIPSIINYYTLCDPENKALIQFKEREVQNKQESDTSLEHF